VQILRLRRLFAGSFPGPVLFGFAIDYSCLLWEKSCDGTTGACLYYDNHEMAWLLMAVCVACKLFTVLCGLLGWRLYVRKGLPQQTRLEHTITAGNNGSAETGNDAGATEDTIAEVNDNPVLGIDNPALEAEKNSLHSDNGQHPRPVSPSGVLEQTRL